MKPAPTDRPTWPTGKRLIFSGPVPFKISSDDPELVSAQETSHKKTRQPTTAFTWINHQRRELTELRSVLGKETDGDWE